MRRGKFYMIGRSFNQDVRIGSIAAINLERGGKRSATPLWICCARIQSAVAASLCRRTPKTVEIIFKDGVGYDSEKLIQSV